MTGHFSDVFLSAEHEYEAFRLNSPSVARKRQIMLFPSRVYDINMHLKKLCDKRFRRIFSSAFQWCRWFSEIFHFHPQQV